MSDEASFVVNIRVAILDLKDHQTALPLVVAALKEYIRRVDQYEMGRSSYEIFATGNGVVVTAEAKDNTGVKAQG